MCIGTIGVMRRDPSAVVLVLVAGLLLGLWRGGNEINAQKGYVEFYGSTVVLQGIVREDPSYDVDGDLRMRLKEVVVDGKNTPGDVWVSLRERVVIKRSDSIIVEGQLSKGFGTIPAALYRARVQKIERQAFSDVGRETRDEFAEGIREGVQEPEASLGSGFLLGQKTALPEKLDQELRLLGLTHIVVASGYNLSILVRFARRLFAKVSRFTALSLSGLLVFGFANITGFSPSMSRAALITSLSLLAWYFGRKFHPLVLLPFSAAITVYITPSYAWGDIGWLLSFMSFIGVIMLSPLIHSYFWGDKKAGNIRQVFIETMSAQLLTLPIIAFVFGQYSPLALLANLLILPLIPIAMLLTFIAGICGLLLPSAASMVGWPAEVVMRYMTSVVDILAQQPSATSEVKFSITSVLIFYVVLVGAMVYLWRRTHYEFRDYNIIE